MTERVVDDLCVEVMKGVEALRNGEYVEYTDETLPELVEDIARRGHKRAIQASQNDES